MGGPAPCAVPEQTPPLQMQRMTEVVARRDATDADGDSHGCRSLWVWLEVRAQRRSDSCTLAHFSWSPYDVAYEVSRQYGSQASSWPPELLDAAPSRFTDSPYLRPREVPCVATVSVVLATPPQLANELASLTVSS